VKRENRVCEAKSGRRTTEKSKRLLEKGEEQGGSFTITPVSHCSVGRFLPESCLKGLGEEKVRGQGERSE
jgi:hypothetical protein